MRTFIHILPEVLQRIIEIGRRVKDRTAKSPKLSRPFRGRFVGGDQPCHRRVILGDHHLFARRKTMDEIR